MYSKKGINNENSQIKIVNHLSEVNKDLLINDILTGLLCEKKYISSIFFYNDVGSKLFEKITCLPEYYIPQIEKTLIREAALQIRNELNDSDLVEFGSGNCSKISILLDAVPVEYIRTIRYIPIDISRTALLETTGTLSCIFPDLNIYGILADFVHQWKLLPDREKRIYCLFGSTIGNFTREGGIQFCSKISTIMHPKDLFLLGLDMVKDQDILHKAYNDCQNVTAQFNRNILNVVNKLTSTNFDLNAFEHLAIFNETQARIEMYLRATKDIVAVSPYCSERIRLKAGETIHTENSYKFTPQHIEQMAKAANLKIRKIRTDKQNWFSLVEFYKSCQNYD